LNSPNSSAQLPNQPDLLDIIAICWAVIAMILFSATVFGDWTGKWSFVLTEVTLGSFCAIYLFTRRINISVAFRWRLPSTRFWLPGIATALGTMILMDELDRLVGMMISVPIENLSYMYAMYEPGNFSEAALVVIGIGIAAPFVEESLFRGVIQQAFERRRDPTSAVLWSSLLFAVVHLQYWWMIQIMLLSVLLGYLAWEWDSIYPGFLIHAANNIWSLIVMFWMTPGRTYYYLLRDHVHPLWLFIAIGSVTWGLRKSVKLAREWRDNTATI
jgi:membrane protease YdiL (CAAX protease family)